MTSKQRAYLKGLAMTMDPIFQIGKSSLTPEITEADQRSAGSPGADQDQRISRTVWTIRKRSAAVVAERTRSQVVQVIGKKIVLYREGKDKRKRNQSPVKGVIREMIREVQEKMESWAAPLIRSISVI